MSKWYGTIVQEYGQVVIRLPAAWLEAVKEDLKDIMELKEMKLVEA